MWLHEQRNGFPVNMMIPLTAKTGSVILHFTVPKARQNAHPPTTLSLPPTSVNGTSDTPPAPHPTSPHPLTHPQLQRIRKDLLNSNGLSALLILIIDFNERHNELAELSMNINAKQGR